MDKRIIGVVLAIAVIGLGSFVMMRGGSAQTAAVNTTTPTTTQVETPVTSTTTPTPSPTATQQPPVTQKTTYTLADVATHPNATSCWAAVNGKVYDLTKWIGQHPGGSAKILAICGKDGSSAFNGKHGGQKRPESELAGFYLADLAK